MRIAVVENDKLKICSIFEPGFITVYEEAGKEWKVMNRFENKICNAKGLAGVRTAVMDTIKQFDDVKILVASEITGIAFGAFQAEGFEIFRVENGAANVLDSIKEEMLELIEERKEKPPEFDIMQFFKPCVNKGDFYLNMEEVLLKNPELTSKKILFPYLKNEKFNNLDVTCSHIPKWFSTDLGGLGFVYETVTELPNRKTVRIKHVKTL